MSPQPRLACDEMLGKLARWLRLLGYDTTYARGRSDDEVLAAAHGEGRLLLTRDAALAARAPAGQALLVRSLASEEQLREVLAALPAPPGAALRLGRCTLCNTALAQASRAEAEGNVPPSVWAAHSAYWRCPACQHYYWRGTHAARIEAQLRALLGEERAP